MSVWGEDAGSLQTRHMLRPPSAAHTLARSACAVIGQPESKLASAGWPAGGTKRSQHDDTGNTSTLRGDTGEAGQTTCGTELENGKKKNKNKHPSRQEVVVNR